jgi:hypothetical protein
VETALDAGPGPPDKVAFHARRKAVHRTGRRTGRGARPRDGRLARSRCKLPSGGVRSHPTRRSLGPRRAPARGTSPSRPRAGGRRRGPSGRAAAGERRDHGASRRRHPVPRTRSSRPILVHAVPPCAHPEPQRARSARGASASRDHRALLRTRLPEHRRTAGRLRGLGGAHRRPRAARVLPVRDELVLHLRARARLPRARKRSIPRQGSLDAPTGSRHRDRRREARTRPRARAARTGRWRLLGRPRRALGSSGDPRSLAADRASLGFASRPGRVGASLVASDGGSDRFRECRRGDRRCRQARSRAHLRRLLRG